MKRCVQCSNFIRLPTLVFITGIVVIIIISVVIVVIIVLLIILLIFGFLGVILLLLLTLLYLTQLLPLLQETVGLSRVICDDDVVENRAALHLPQIEPNETKIVVLVHCPM